MNACMRMHDVYNAPRCSSPRAAQEQPKSSSPTAAQEQPKSSPYASIVWWLVRVHGRSLACSRARGVHGRSLHGLIFVIAWWLVACMGVRCMGACSRAWGVHGRSLLQLLSRIAHTPIYTFVRAIHTHPFTKGYTSLHMYICITIYIYT
jgi:hypothetical protein